jgi:hypothetical protein
MLKIGRLEQEIGQEIRSPLEMRTDGNVVAGMTPE